MDVIVRGLHFKLLSVLTLFCIISGCASTRVATQIQSLETRHSSSPRLLIMTPDVKYYLMTASGYLEPQGAWTNSARNNFEKSLNDHLESISTDIVLLPHDYDTNEELLAYRKLYGAVGFSIMKHHFGGMPLPAKEGRFDWTLGDGILPLGEQFESDYALFTYYRDHQASGGRIALGLVAAAFGVGISMGYEGGFAAMVDLSTGDVVWFNNVAAGIGELRDEGGADDVVATLLKDLPQRP